MLQKVEVNGIELSYYDKGEGPVILFVHAFPLNSKMWEFQDGKAIPEYRAIVPDLRGFGTSGYIPGPCTMETYASDLVALLDDLKIEQVILAGLSMGGYIAFAFLRHYRERLRGLILANTRSTADTEEVKINRENTALLVEREGMVALSETMPPKMLSPATAQENRDFLHEIIKLNRPEGVAAALRGMALRPDSTDLLPTINIPTLVIAGSDDILTPPKEVRHMQAAIPCSRLVEIPGAGHVSNVDQPHLFNKAISDFIKSL